MSVEISGLHIVRFPKVNNSGYVVIAYFNCTANGIGMDGCALMHRRGTIHISPPQIIDETRQKRIVICDPVLRDEIQSRILLAYRGLGGNMPESPPVGNPQQDQSKSVAVSASGRPDIEQPDGQGLAKFMAGAA